MIETQLKSICRLNRVLVLVLSTLTFYTAWTEAHWWSKALYTGLFLGHFGFLMGNEFLLKGAKRFRDADTQTVMHLSLFLPVLLGGYIALNYVLTGNFLIYLLGAFSMLQAHFLGRTKLGKWLAVSYLALFAAGLPFGIPHPLTLNTGGMLLMAISWGLALSYYGISVSRLVRTHTSEVGKLQSMAATDVLTGLTNRRQFNSRLHEEIARARRHETPLTLALFDLDDFKRLNDFYGHPVGDRILRELGKLVRQNIRESDLPSRYGGEEFALILPETRETEGYELLERIRLLVAQTVFCLPENPLTITVSVGVAQLEPRQHTAFELVELADKALYEAKKQGKNQVVRASALMPKILLTDKSGKRPF